MNDKHQRDDALSAEYALGTLRGNARLRFEKRLAQEPELAQQLARWQNMLSGLDSELVPQIPPERVWKKITLNLPQQPVAKKTLKPYWGWLVAAGLAAFTLISNFHGRAPDVMPLTVLSNAEQQAQWVVSSSSDRQQLVLTPLKPVAVAAQNSLQLWLIPGGQKPVSLGLVDERTPTQLTLNQITLPPGAVVAISLEPHGGSPTSQPTGPVLFSGVL